MVGGAIWQPTGKKNSIDSNYSIWLLQINIEKMQAICSQDVN